MFQIISIMESARRLAPFPLEIGFDKFEKVLVADRVYIYTKSRHDPRPITTQMIAAAESCRWHSNRFSCTQFGFRLQSGQLCRWLSRRGFGGLLRLLFLTFRRLQSLPFLLSTLDLSSLLRLRCFAFTFLPLLVGEALLFLCLTLGCQPLELLQF
jgi:hypothetical protein